MVQSASSPTPLHALRELLQRAAQQVKGCEGVMTRAVRPLEREVEDLPPERVDDPWYEEQLRALDLYAIAQPVLAQSFQKLERIVGYLLPDAAAFAVAFPGDPPALAALGDGVRELAGRLPAGAEAVLAWSSAALGPLLPARRAGQADEPLSAEVAAEGRRLTGAFFQDQLALAAQLVRLMQELSRIFGDPARAAALCRGTVTPQRLERALAELADKIEDLQRLAEEPEPA